MTVVDKQQSMTGLTILYVGDMIVAYLEKHGGARSLHELRLFTETLSRDDAAISRAFATLQSAKRISVDHTRTVRLLPYE